MGLFSFMKTEEKKLMKDIDHFKDTLDLEATEAMEVIEKQQAVVAQLKYRPWRHAVFLLILSFVLMVSFFLMLLKYEQQLYIFGRTWVAYNNPPVVVTVVSDFQNCVSVDCKSSEEFVVGLMKEKIGPTIKVNYLDQETLQAKNLIETYNIHALPAFIFDENLTKIDNWEEQKAFFKKQGDKYLFDLKVALVEPKSFLTIKNPNEDNLIFGESELKPPIIIQWFVDLIERQSINILTTIESLQKKYPQQIKVYLYEVPLPDQVANSYNLALAWECLQEQNQHLNLLTEIKKTFKDNEELDDLGSIYTLSKIKEVSTSFEWLDIAQFDSCFNQEKFDFVLKDNLQRAEDLGLIWLPSFILNNKIINNKLEINDLESLLKKYLD